MNRQKIEKKDRKRKDAKKKEEKRNVALIWGDHKLRLGFETDGFCKANFFVWNRNSPGLERIGLEKYRVLSLARVNTTVYTRGIYFQNFLSNPRKNRSWVVPKLQRTRRWKWFFSPCFFFFHNHFSIREREEKGNEIYFFSAKKSSFPSISFSLLFHFLSLHLSLSLSLSSSFSLISLSRSFDLHCRKRKTFSPFPSHSSPFLRHPFSQINISSSSSLISFSIISLSSQKLCSVLNQFYSFSLLVVNDFRRWSLLSLSKMKWNLRFTFLPPLPFPSFLFWLSLSPPSSALVLPLFARQVVEQLAAISTSHNLISLFSPVLRQRT